MKVYDLVHSVSPFDMLKSMRIENGDNANDAGYLEVMDYLKRLEPDKSDFQCVVTNLSDDGTSYLSVHGIKYGQPVTYSLSFTPWSQWLSMEVVNECGATNETLLASILWEMTFHGFSEDDVQQIYTEVMDNAKDAGVYN